jgi:hypothetical protein
MAATAFARRHESHRLYLPDPVPSAALRVSILQVSWCFKQLIALKRSCSLAAAMREPSRSKGHTRVHIRRMWDGFLGIIASLMGDFYRWYRRVVCKIGAAPQREDDCPDNPVDKTASLYRNLTNGKFSLINFETSFASIMVIESRSRFLCFSDSIAST